VDLNIRPALLAAFIRSEVPLTTGKDSFRLGMVASTFGEGAGDREMDDRGLSSRTRVTPRTVGKAALVRARLSGGGRRRGFRTLGVANFPPVRLYALALSFFFPPLPDGDLYSWSKGSSVSP
jgi:hypothetical protein